MLRSMFVFHACLPCRFNDLRFNLRYLEVTVSKVYKMMQTVWRLSEVRLKSIWSLYELQMGMLSVYLYVYLSICLSIYLSISLSVYLSIYLSICLSIYLSSVFLFFSFLFFSFFLSFFLYIYILYSSSPVFSFYGWFILEFSQLRKCREGKKKKRWGPRSPLRTSAMLLVWAELRWS